jgi:hypothetical protein
VCVSAGNNRQILLIVVTQPSLGMGNSHVDSAAVAGLSVEYGVQSSKQVRARHCFEIFQRCTRKTAALIDLHPLWHGLGQ